MAWIARVLAVFIVLAAGMGAAQQAPRRIALVIGNGAYQVSTWRLANPPRDASLMAERLRGLGFEVDLAPDVDRRAMEGAFARFGQRLKAAGPDAVGLFYYAGHGAQKDGVNLLVPVDATARTMDELRYQSPAMQFLLNDMAEAGNAVNLIILDACRDIPLEEGMRGGGGGLADVGRVANVFIAYAAAPGRTASDGTTGNSPFTTALAQALASQPGDPVELLFSDVQSRVYRASAGGQSPEYRNGLVRAPRWSFAVARTAPSAPPPLPNFAALAADFRANANTQIFFDVASTALRPDNKPFADSQIAWLRAHPQVSVLLEGNADERELGIVEATSIRNLALGRAAAVRVYMLDAGIDPARVSIASFGADSPNVARSTEDAWAMNRGVVTRLRP